jgi:predicted ABC-type ATPase
MVVFAGPNGSGKSTATNTRAKGFPGVYINADDIARTELAHIADAVERNMEAAKLADRRRREAIDAGRSFVFETVMSTPGKLVILQEAKRRGFEVELIFVTTNDADINIGRVADRVAKGGHAVDPARVRERYERAMQLLPSAVDLADKANIYDNSVSFLRVAEKRGSRLSLVNAGEAPAWVAERLAKPCRERAKSRARIEAAFRRATAGASSPPPKLADADIGHGKVYSGPVVEATRYHVLQKTGPDSCTVHDRALCPLHLKKGMTATVVYRYKNGKFDGQADVSGAAESSGAKSNLPSN